MIITTENIVIKAKRHAVEIISIINVSTAWRFVFIIVVPVAGSSRCDIPVKSLSLILLKDVYCLSK
jgi:hypothetical protein